VTEYVLGSGYSAATKWGEGPRMADQTVPDRWGTAGAGACTARARAVAAGADAARSAAAAAPAIRAYPPAAHASRWIAGRV